MYVNQKLVRVLNLFESYFEIPVFYDWNILERLLHVFFVINTFFNCYYMLVYDRPIFLKGCYTFFYDWHIFLVLQLDFY